MVLRKLLGKVSTFLRSKNSGGKSASAIRRQIRGNSEFPNSSKVGAGTDVTARRKKLSNIHHLKNHRQTRSKSVIISYNEKATNTLPQ